MHAEDQRFPVVHYENSGDARYLHCILPQIGSSSVLPLTVIKYQDCPFGESSLEACAPGVFCQNRKLVGPFPCFCNQLSRPRTVKRNTSQSMEPQNLRARQTRRAPNNKSFREMIRPILLST